MKVSADKKEVKSTYLENETNKKSISALEEEIKNLKEIGRDIVADNDNKTKTLNEVLP